GKNGRGAKGTRPPEGTGKIAIHLALCFRRCSDCARRQGARHRRIGAGLRRHRLLHFSHQSRSTVRRSARRSAFRSARAKDCWRKKILTRTYSLVAFRECSSHSSESRNSPTASPSFGGQGKIEARSRRQLVFRCNDSTNQRGGAQRSPTPCRKRPWL